MPRQERPVDPHAGPVQQFASELRKLRDEAGTPTYRKLAEQTHFSKATLAAAASGHRLPTLDVTLAFVQACGGDIQEWKARWSDTRRELGQSDNDQTESPDPSPPLASIPRLRVIWAATGAALLAGIALTVILASTGRDTTSRDSTSAHPSGDEPSSARFVPTGALSTQPVVDGADPKRTACASDPNVKTLDSVEINTDSEVFLGVAELRFSPRCNVAWGRFTPAEGNVRLTGAIITITARRNLDTPTTAPFEVQFDGQAAFGNILLMRNGCIEATVQVTTPLSGQAQATTHCSNGR